MKLKQKEDEKMSFTRGMDNIQEGLVLALVLVFVVAVFYSKIEFLYKIITSVLVFGIIFLIGLVNRAIKEKNNENSH